MNHTAEERDLLEGASDVNNDSFHTPGVVLVMPSASTAAANTSLDGSMCGSGTLRSAIASCASAVK
jgi:hypothetical protein